MSPWTDLPCSGDAYRRRDPLAPDGSWQTFAAYYAGAHDRTDPLVSPLYGDPAGLPPLPVYAGDDEAMLDDATRFAAKRATPASMCGCRSGRAWCTAIR